MASAIWPGQRKSCATKEKGSNYGFYTYIQQNSSGIDTHAHVHPAYTYILFEGGNAAIAEGWMTVLKLVFTTNQHPIAPK